VLLVQARQGDERAFEALFERYMARIRRGIARALPGAVHRKISISDVVQEARIVAMRRLGDFEDRGPGSFGAWLSKIVEVKIHEAVRKYKGPAKRDIA
jgi:DNA-directed RNA polymerase specialized sigma24 family protein